MSDPLIHHRYLFDRYQGAAASRRAPVVPLEDLGTGQVGVLGGCAVVDHGPHRSEHPTGRSRRRPVRWSSRRTCPDAAGPAVAGMLSTFWLAARATGLGVGWVSIFGFAEPSLRGPNSVMLEYQSVRR